MKKIFFLLSVLTFILIGCKKNSTEPASSTISDAIIQYGNKQAFLERKFVGQTTYSEIKKQGDFGLGTFNFVDGEMAAVNNNFIRIPDTGELHAAYDTLKAPYAVVKFFNTDDKFSSANKLTFSELTNQILQAFADTSKPIAIKVTGKFISAKTRSVHRQAEPFPSLQEIVADQVVFDLENVEGSMVGYWFPKFMDGVNFPGFHFHFLSADLSKGGHLLDCETDNVVVEIDYADRLIIN